MKKIFIKYNPYKLTTYITIDGKPLKKNSRLNVGERRLQEWIDDLPMILSDECNTNSFEIEFHGTILDYEDVIATAKDAKKQGIDIRVKHIKAKEVKDKEIAIQNVFDKIQKGPFPELKSDDVINAFKLAKSKDFEVCVVATMSAGKSTLINSLLGQRLMPAKQEACTATITEIKDNDKKSFSAEVYGADGKLIETQKNLTYSIMERLNLDERVSRIHIEGDIPFVTADDVSLVLLDTPGPNNGRDPRHREITEGMLDESSKALVLYIMNATNLHSEGDYKLLNQVAESMKVGGKQSRDRFIFVVNKLDLFKQGEDNVESSLNRVKEFLADTYGMEHPNIYPASALTALNIRTILTDSENADPIELYEANGQVLKFNSKEAMHFEKYAPVPASVEEYIEAKLNEAKAAKDLNAEALIHSGIVSIEEAIRMYVRKYSKTAKIKNIVDTFAHRLESEKSFETVKNEIAINDEARNKFIEEVSKIEEKVNSAKDAQAFKNKIDAINFNETIKNSAQKIRKKAEKSIHDITQKTNAKKKIKVSEAITECKDFAKLTEELQREVKREFEKAIRVNMKEVADSLLQEYKSKIENLEEINIEKIQFSPFKLIEGDFVDSGIVNLLPKTTERVKTGQRRVVEKHWYNHIPVIGDWFDPDVYYEDIMTDVEFVNAELLTQKYFTPILKNLVLNELAAIKYAEDETIKIKSEYLKRFNEIDKLLKVKLRELKRCAEDKENAEKQFEESKAKLDWLKNIQEELDNILEL